MPNLNYAHEVAFMVTCSYTILVRCLTTHHNSPFQFVSVLLGITLDLSRQKVDDSTIQLLCKHAHSARLDEKIHDMFHGKRINQTENRAVLHVALRGAGMPCPNHAVTNNVMTKELAKEVGSVDCVCVGCESA